MEKKIYLDNAATTRVTPEVLDVMLPYFSENFGNPSAIYELATQNIAGINTARRQIADLINADMREIYFTSGGTESDNWALKGTAFALKAKGNHIITDNIEHHAIMNSCEFLKKNGFEITYLQADEYGHIMPEQLKKAIRSTTILVSVMSSNNEIGTIEPIADLCGIAHDYGALFHTDAVQSFGHIPLDVKALGVDMMSASAHKLHGPKGIGMLYIRDGINPEPFQHGGAQERRRRAGTENVPGIIGFGKAAQIAGEHMNENFNHMVSLRNYMIERILKEVPYTRLNGDRNNRLPGNCNFSFQFVEGESLLILLDMQGVCAASGSACTTHDPEPSHVLTAIGLPEDVVRGSLRLTMSDETTKEEIDETIEKIKVNVDKIRGMSPIYEAWLKNRA